MTALVSVFNGLPLNKFRVGLMLYREAGRGNHGAYVRAALRPMDSTNRPLYSALIGSLGKNSDNAAPRQLGLAMYEAYQYFSSGPAYAGTTQPKRDFAGNSVASYPASNAVYALPGNAFASASSTNYTSPITDSCQRNFIIYIGNSTAQGNVTSDSTSDNTTSGSALTAAGGDATQISISPTSMSDNYANEWTRFMKRGPLGISTYTIDVSLGNNGNGPGNSALLKSMADVGGGKYFHVNGNSTTVGADIAKALGAIFSEIQSVNSVFASVSLPVSVNTQGTYLNQVFVGMFRPDIDSSPRWAGNLKQYKLGVLSGALGLLDSTGASAINSGTGFIAECARSFWTSPTTDSYWAFKSWPTGTTFCIPPSGTSPTLYQNSNSPDGNIVEKGAQAYVLRQNTTRTEKTCGTTMAGCSSLISLDSTSVSAAALGASSHATEQAALISWSKGLDVDDENVNGITTTEMRSSAHGDIVHSRPVAVNFGTSTTSQVVVFYGGNDGLLRAVNGNRGDISGSTAIGSYAVGSELWSFMPPEFYSKIKRLRDNSPPVLYPTTVYGTSTVPAAKQYGMDGPVTAFNGTISGANKTFVYGTMRRGGRSIYAFDVTNSLTAPSSPTLKWRVGCSDRTDTDCKSGFTGIGQTWSSLKSFTTSGYSSGTSPLVIFGGGYDSCEDYDALVAGGANNNCTSLSKGHYVYVLDADTGAIVKTFDTGGWRGVIADVTMVRDSSGQAIYGYTADLGGNVYRINFNGAPSAWTMSKIAALGCDGNGTCAVGAANRKFMFGPSVIATDGVPTVNSNFVIMLGSGDREKPLTYYAAATAVTNLFFAFTDKPATAASTYPGSANCGTTIICMNSLVGITTSATPTATQLAARQGWYLGLAPTEQVVTSAITIFGVVTFSTHQPAVPVTGSCSSNLGKTLVYNIGYTNAASVNGTSNRYEHVAGDGLPPSPVAGDVTLDDGTTVPFCIGCSPKSPLEGAPPRTLSSVIQPKGRLYWYLQK